MALTRITQGVIKPNENYDTHNINSTGIVTATGLNISGNASIGGVLTYEDVTNVDSIGIITARSDIKVGTAVTLTSAGAGFYAGIVTASDFVKRDGSSVGGFTPSNSSGLTRGGTSSGSAGSNNTFFGLQAGQNATSTTQRCTAVGAEAFKLGSNVAYNVTAMGWYALQQSTGNNNTGVGLAAFQFTTSGKGNTGLGKNCGRFITSGDYNTVIGCDVAQNATEGDNNTLIGYAAEPSSATVSNEITLGDSNITKFRIPGIGVSFSDGGNHISGITTFADDIKLPDEKNIFLGTDSDLQIFHTNTGNQSFIKSSGTKLTITAATLDINNAADTEILAKFIQNGSVQLFYDYSSHNTPKLQTSATGITVDGTVTDSKGDLRSIPQQNEQGSTHTLVAADAGKHILADNTVTVPPTSGIFSAGDAITIINAGSSDISIAKGSGVVLYNSADGTDAGRTLAAKGMATILCGGSNTYYISGAGLS